ncbi:hypothetical protein Pst134EA_011958 [Puccinia striiformis f. sp. tritici]|uniref:hypothetical protein n=1 Tax=Puccinia striiformis f. sp. tritici TaxID=168172 RepID=UPI002008B4F7|nr:hypothetical protein Pst134EA_011958 [Puccinia striiformis f. sp. tritici]KAH9468334.1 hypothetical protein Pst134EA_011958 [Puccinia striiformis f. sp. tritici]
MAISPNEERSVSPEPKPERMQNEQQERPASVQEEHQNGSHRDSDPDDRQPSPHSREGEGEPIDNKNGLKEQEEGDHQSTTNDDHKSRSRREKDSRVHHHHRSDDRSRDREKDHSSRSGNGRRHRSVRSDRERDLEKSERTERPEKPVDRSPGKDSDIRSHSSRPSHHRRHRSRSHEHETTERTHNNADHRNRQARDSRDRRDNRDRERDRERPRERGERTREPERERTREPERERTREPEREREKDRSGRDRERERERERERDPKRSSQPRSRDPEGDRDDERHRKRHRSRSRERSKDLSRPPARDLDRRENERQRRFDQAEGDDRRRRPDRRSPRYRPYEPTGSPPRRSSSPHLTEEEHEMRSVFVSQLSARVGDRELFQFFEQQAGKVRDARLITDRISRRSKGVGYVEFRELDSVQKALSLTGTKLLGLPVMVQYTEAEKNRQAMANTQPNVPPGFVPTNLNSTNPTANATNSTMVATPLVPRTYVTPKARGPGPNDPNSYARLYVGSLNFNLTDDDIRQVFQPFGDIEYVDLHRDQITGKSKGYAFVQFKNMHDAKNAMEKMNGFQLAGRALRVEIKAQPPAALLNATAPGVANPVMVTPTGGNFAVNVATVVPPSNNFEERLEEPMGGNLNQISRVELMHKLARTEQPTNIPVTDMFRPNIPTATSRSVLLKNMFNPEEETEQGWDVELRDDVKGECEEKYGPVLAIAIEKESSAGDIYITFDSVPSAQKAITGLNNRWFGGRQITAAFISDALVAAHGGK